jgi:Protein of unknown function (DUF2946)
VIADFMTATATGYSRSGRMGVASRLVVLVALLAFVLQSFITQTHIHGMPQGLDGRAIGAAHAKLPARGNSPLDNNSLDCPVCHAITHAYAIFSPATPILILVAIWLELAVPSVIAHAVSAIATFNWQSRAPPQH